MINCDEITCSVNYLLFVGEKLLTKHYINYRSIRNPLEYIIAEITDTNDISSVKLRLSATPVYFYKSDVPQIPFLSELNEIVDRYIGEIIAYRLEIKSLWESIPDDYEIAQGYRTLTYKNGVMFTYSSVRKPGFDLIFNKDKPERFMYLWGKKTTS